MKKNLWLLLSAIFFQFIFWSCNSPASKENTSKNDTTMSEVQKKLNQYVNFKLTADLTSLSEKEKQMIPILLQAAEIADEIYWIQSFGKKDSFCTEIKDEATLKFFEINYGPWDRLDGEKPFIECFGAKPDGANFYPKDMTKDEFEKFPAKDKASLYTMIRRNADKSLVSIPYHVFFNEKIVKMADLIKKAAALAEDAGLKKYLELRASALLSDDYFKSDMAWMEMKNNTIDFIIGPIENYEDQLFGYKAAFESFLLIKDKEWSKRLEKYSAMLPDLQKALPVADKYKKEKPGSESDLNAYDAVYYAGDCNSGSKTIAINLPNDEKVQLAKGSRRLQLKNSMQAKFENILVPITSILIAPDQRKYVKFDAFFSNTMFHEVAHGLGIKNLLNGKGTVREALKEQYSTLEENKADILGLWMVAQLKNKGEIKNDLMENYVTFLAGIFRSIRFGASSAHGKANLTRYYYFKEKGAFTQNADGTYSVNFDKMTEAMNSLSEYIITVQGDGNYDEVVKMMKEKCVIGEGLQKDLDKLKAANIPVDVVFTQGKSVLGL